MALTPINGTDIIIKIATVTLSGQLSTNITLSADPLDATNKGSTGGWKEYIMGELGGSINVSSLYDPISTVTDNAHVAITQLIAKASVAIIWGKYTTGMDDLFMSGFINNVSIDGPKNELASYTLDITITGVVSNTTTA